MSLRLPDEVWETIFSFIPLEESLSFLSFALFRKYILNNIHKLYLGGADCFAGNSITVTDISKLCRYFKLNELDHVRLELLSIKSIKHYLQVSELLPNLLANSRKIDLTLQKVKYLPKLPKNLTRLNCHTKSAVDLESFRDLEHLKVNNSRIDSLPPNLTKLNIKSCRLLKSVDFSSSINHLIVNNCKFTNDWNLPNLSHLSLTNCSIDHINHLPLELTHLDLSNNNITTLNNVSFPSTLTYLNLSNNKIDQICRQNFSQVSHLDYLNLSNNPVKELTPMIFLPLSMNKLIINHEIQKINLDNNIVNLSVHISSLNRKKLKLPDTIKHLKLTQLNNQFITNDRYFLPPHLSTLQLNGICFDGRLMKDFVPETLWKIVFKNCSIFNFDPQNVSEIEFVNCKIETMVHFSDKVKVVRVSATSLNKLDWNLQTAIYVN